MEKYNEQVFYKKAALKTFVIFRGKNLCWSLFFNKSAVSQSWNFIKKWLQHRCFPVNIAKFLRTPVVKNICERMFNRFSTWINNIRNIWNEYFFEKTKQQKVFKLSWMKKLAFLWCSWAFRFSLFLQCMSGGFCST